MKPLIAFIPENLSLESEKHRDKFYFVISEIIKHRITDRRVNSEDYIQLSSIYLQKMLTGVYKKYIDFMISRGVLESDNHYIVAKKSKGYRLGKKYRGVLIKEVEINNTLLSSKYWHAKKSQKELLKDEHIKFLYYCLTCIEFDYHNALNLISSKKLTTNQYNSWFGSICRLKIRDFFFIIDRTVGRVHNNITNLPRELRKFISFNNTALVEVDIANSQPLLFNLLIHNYYREHLHKIYSTNIIPYVDKLPDDVKTYRRLTQAGEFYEFIMNSMGIKEVRAEFKIRFFTTIFFGSSFRSKEWKYFRLQFPNVAKIVYHYKKKDYKNLAIKLQTAEADLIINKIVKKLTSNKIFILTIHDSILTTKDNVQLVKKTMEAEFKKYDLQPTLRIKGGK